jgi:polyketide cyclase/dehydrase/lipid transport protein
MSTDSGNTPVTSIDEAAPVIARHEIEIQAPLDIVWGLHVNVPGWPTWNTDITEATLEQPFAPGASFLWQTAGLSIRSTIYEVTERARTLWGGTASGITGIHEWTFDETSGGTRVRTDESWSGKPVEANVAMAQAGLDQSLVSWLNHMKTAAEARA